jgi:hypothetical protein
MKRFLLFILAAACCTGGATASMETDFRDVPQANKPWCYWFWANGNVDRETITADLESMKALGFGGLLLLDPRGYWDDENHGKMPKAECGWMSPGWLSNMTFGVREAARLGLEFTMVLGSCGGSLKGPWETGADAPKRLVCQTFSLQGGSEAKLTFAKPDLPFFHDIGIFAVRYEGTAVTPHSEWQSAGDGDYTMAASSGKRVDGGKAAALRAAAEFREVTDKVKDGLFDWQVPQGQWILVRFGWTTIPGREYEVDILDPKAVAGHFERAALPILRDIGPLAGKTLTHFYGVSWEGSVPTWTESFEAGFKKHCGYDIRPLMPLLAGFTADGAEGHARFMEDFHRCRNEMFRENCYITLRDLSVEHGIKWYSESGGPWQRTPPIFREADQSLFLSVNGIPQGEFWFNGVGKAGRYHTSGAVSAAHAYGLRRASAEAFTHMTMHYSAYPAALKPLGDSVFADGINLLVWHTFTCSPKRFGTPGTEYFAGTHINRNVTWQPYAGPFVRYLGRCQTLLQRGLPVVDIAVFMGDRAYQGWGLYRSRAYDGGTVEIPQGYASDVLNTDVLTHRAKAQGGRIVLPDGMSYGALVVDPDSTDVSVEALKAIAGLQKEGVPIVAGTRKPARAPGLHPQDDAEVRRLADGIWDNAKKLADVLPPRDCEGPFAFCHRSDSADDIYFVCGTGRTNVAFRAKADHVEIWDAVTGERAAAVSAAMLNGRTSVTLDLPENGSAFVLFRNDKDYGGAVTGQRPAPANHGTDVRPAKVLDGAWDVDFQKGRGAPEHSVFGELTDWTASRDEGIRHFSGTAVYRKTFTLAEEETRAKWLDVGRVGVIARIVLNGSDCGVAWTAPWRVDVGGRLRAGKNELEIEVTNTWVNRLIGDAALPEGKRLTQSFFHFRDGPRNGLPIFAGYASTDALQPSGLCGPVRLLR